MKKKIIFTVIIILLIATAWFEHPVTEHIKVSSNGKLNSPLRIALVTDLHSCYYGKNQSQLIKMIDAENVDMILLAGDIFDDRLSDANAKAFIEGVCERYSCYYVAGNHEFWSGYGCKQGTMPREDALSKVLQSSGSSDHRRGVTA